MVNEYDVHFAFNGYMRITATSEEDARTTANEILSKAAVNIEHDMYLNVVDPDEDYVTEVVEPW
jgi:hypothetical protein